MALVWTSSHVSLNRNSLQDGGVVALAQAIALVPRLAELLFLFLYAPLDISLFGCDVTNRGARAILELAEIHPVLTSIEYRFVVRCQCQA